MSMAARIVWWVVAAGATAALFEYFGHYLMHRLAGTRIHRDHALLHHDGGVNTPEVIDLALTTHLKFGGIVLVIFFGLIDVIGAVALTVAFMLHAVLWTSLHRQIHGVEENWSRRLPGFALIRRHHLFHHVRTDRNYAVIFPFMDRLLGTRYEAPRRRPTKREDSSDEAVYVTIAGGRRVCVRSRGDGPDMVLLHGLGMSGRDWYNQRPLTAHLRLHAVDLPGHGLSDPCTSGTSLAELARDVIEALDRLGVQRFHLLGSSMGGMIAQHIAALVPDRVDRLILHNTAASMHKPLLRAFLDSPGGRLVYGLIPLPMLARVQLWRLVPDPVARRVYFEGWLPPDRASYLDCAHACLRHDARLLLPAIRANTLVLSAERDGVFRPEAGRELARAIAGAQFGVLEGSGHASPADAPALFNAAVLGFVHHSPAK